MAEPSPVAILVEAREPTHQRCTIADLEDRNIGRRVK